MRSAAGLGGGSEGGGAALRLSELRVDQQGTDSDEYFEISGAPGASLAQLLCDTGLVSSVSAGRRAIAEGGVYLNNQKVDDETATLDAWLNDRFAVLRRGKKTLAGIFRA